MNHDERIGALRAAIDRARQQGGRAPGSVRLLAVSKTRTADEVRAAHAAGIDDFGENYVQEALAKMAPLADCDITWHFIGAIQSNKTRDIGRHFQWVHTVDRARIASRLDAAAATTLDVCIQVNINAEPQKAGVAADELAPLVAHVRRLPRLRLRGLMTIPRPGADPRAGFRRTKALFDAASPSAGPHWDTLSMGMSGDFPTAIAEGATLVRIGTAIFGPRPAAGSRREAVGAALQ